LKRKPKTKKQKPYDECVALWAECVKSKAGYKSEYSGKWGKQIGGEEILHAHHICGKSSHQLRFCIENGVCLTSGEHKFIAHHAGRYEYFREFIVKVRGWDFYETMKLYKHQGEKADLEFTKSSLKSKLEEFKNDYKNSE